MSGHRFPGGLRLDPHKLASETPLRVLPTPSRLVVPMLQHAGLPAQPCVAVGDRVRKGERIGEATQATSAHVHAPTSGRVISIEARDIGHPTGGLLPCIEIEADGEEAWQRMPPMTSWPSLSPVLLRARLRDAGVVGLGGATFPSDLKLSDDASAIETLILNGAECEPYIACDDALMRERAHEVLGGAALLAHVCGARRTVIAIEDRMHEALAAIRLAQENDPGLAGIDIETVPTRYPQGGERQLVRAVTGIELAAGVLPRTRGVLCINVGTAAAAHRAVVHGEPLVSRIVSVTGRGVASPCNVDVPVGTPIAVLVDAAGGYTPDADRLVIGGPMMGHAVPHDAIPVAKGSNCVLVLGADDVRTHATEMPCIRCGACADACPARLLPQQLHFHVASNEWAKVRALGLADCIECGLCAYVCPSHIPLVEAFRYGKGELAWQQREAERAQVSKARFERRQARLALAAKAREARLKARESGARTASIAQAAAAIAPTAATATKQPAIAAGGQANAQDASTATPAYPAHAETSTSADTSMTVPILAPTEGSTPVENPVATAPSTRPRPTDAIVAAAIAAARAKSSRTDADAS